MKAARRNGSACLDGKELLHNYFTVKAAGREITALNSVLDVRAILAQNKPFANYIVLGDGGGNNGNTLNSPVFAAPATVTELNADREKGELRATYSILIENQTLSFCEMALCANVDGTGAVNYATCETVGVEGNAVSVSVTVFALMDGEMQILGGWENPIAKWLLGCGKVEGAFKMATGTCTYPQKPMRREAGDLTASVDATAVFSQTGLTFEANLTGRKSEFIILLDGKPVLRYYPDYTTGVGTFSGTPRIYGGFALPKEYPLKVMNVTQNGEPITDFTLRTSPVAMHEVKELLPFSLSEISDVKTDQYEEYMVAVSEKEAILVSFTNGGAHICMRVPREEDDYVEALHGGGIALWSKTNLTVYLPDENGRKTKSTYPVGKGMRNVIIREKSGALHFAKYQSPSVERYGVTEENGLQLLETVSVPNTEQLTRCGEYIVWFNNITGVRTLSGTNQSLQTNIHTFIPLMGIQVLYGVNDCFLNIKAPSGKSVAVLCALPTKTVIGANDTILLGNNQVYLRRTPYAEFLVFLDSQTNKEKSFRTDAKPPFAPVKALCLVKNWLVELLGDNTLRTFYIDSTKSAVESADLTYNQAATYVLQYREIPLSDTATCSVKIELLFPVPSS